MTLFGEHSCVLQPAFLHYDKYPKRSHYKEKRLFLAHGFKVRLLLWAGGKTLRHDGSVSGAE